MTLSINARKAVFSLLWILIISILASITLVSLVANNAATISLVGTAWFEVAETIVIAVLGVVIGLLSERASRTRYIAKLASRPAPSNRAKIIYRIVLILAIIAGAIYVLGNIVVLYGALSLRVAIPVSSVQEAGIYIGMARYIIIALVSIWLFAESKKENLPVTSADIKRYFLWVAIYCLLMAGINLFGLSMFKVLNVSPVIVPTSGATTTANTSATPPLDNPVGTPPSTSSTWITYTFPKEFSVKYPSTWTVVSTSSNELNISSSPTVDTDNGVCKMYASVYPNSSGASWEDWYASYQGQTNLSTSSVMIGGLPAITLTYDETEMPYISTVVADETHALLADGSIVNIMMTCGSNATSFGQPVYQEALTTFTPLY